MKVSPQQVAAMERAVDGALLGLFNFARFLARFLPPRIMVAIANSAGYAMFYLQPGRRRYLLDTIGEALPEKDGKKLEKIARRASGALPRAMLDSILLERHSREMVERLVLDQRILDQFDKNREAGRGMILFSPHLGAIGICPVFCALKGRPFTPIIFSPESTPIPRFLTALMTIGKNAGLDPDDPVFWSGQDTSRKAREHLAKGKRLGLTFDVKGNTIVNFFGQPAALASGLAHFICDSNAPVVSGFFKRGKHPLDYQLIGIPDMPYKLTGDRDKDREAVMEIAIRHAEEMIRMAPEQWIGWMSLKGWRTKAQQILKEQADGDGTA
jgi:lauroyl/myristoyl acyltransferase